MYIIPQYGEKVSNPNDLTGVFLLCSLLLQFVAFCDFIICYISEIQLISRVCKFAGSQKVIGSIPIFSTLIIKTLQHARSFLFSGVPIWSALECPF